LTPHRPTTATATRPALRLVGVGEAVLEPAKRPAGEPITQISDPRWVLAVRAAEQMQGTILPPERRERLIRLGRMLGLSPFDSNLIIAIMQDQARRGFSREDCPRAGEEQLRMISRPEVRGFWKAVHSQPGLRMALAIGAVMLAEILALLWLF
jgi:hypothetical protein